MIPGLDYNSFHDVKSTTTSCHGLPTPPQSALESRRPSLQFSAMPDYGHGTAHNISTYSHPSTPVRNASRHGEPYDHSWSEQAMSTTSTPTALKHSLSSAHLPQPLRQPNFLAQPTYHTSGVDCWESYASTGTHQASSSFLPVVDAPGHETWVSPHHPQAPSVAGASFGLAPSLFTISQPSSTENSALEPLPTSMYTGQSLSSTDHSLNGYGAFHYGTYSQLQVIAPSQLSPQDGFAQQQYNETASPYHDSDGYSNDFPSNTGELADFEMVRPPSPDAMYFDQSDEDGFAPLKSEANKGRMANPSLRRSGNSRLRGHDSKRARNRATTPEFSHNIGPIKVLYQDIGLRDGTVDPSKRTKKNFACSHVYDGGAVCGAAFQRSEHLKRHSNKHSDERNYPCPLAACKKQIQRPDNAADHFKTHLRPDKKGKRNKHCDWVELRRSIMLLYKQLDDGPRRAKKLIYNLQTWLDNGMPESASQKRGTQQDGDGLCTRACASVHNSYP